MISATEMLRDLWACSPKNFELIDAVWCNIDVLFGSDSVLKKYPYLL